MTLFLGDIVRVAAMALYFVEETESGLGVLM